MNYYKNLTEEYDDIEERYELIMERVRQIIHESLVKEPYRDYFSHVAGFIARIGDVLELVILDIFSFERIHVQSVKIKKI